MDDFPYWLIPVIFIGGVIGLFIIIWRCIILCKSEDNGELENFQKKYKYQRSTGTAKRILERLGIQISLLFVKI